MNDGVSFGIGNLAIATFFSTISLIAVFGLIVVRKGLYERIPLSFVFVGGGLRI